MERKDVYLVIDQERKRQDLMAVKWKNEGTPSLEAELLIAEEYLQEARNNYVHKKGDTAALHSLRKVTATLIRCFENHGVPEPQ